MTIYEIRFKKQAKKFINSRNSKDKQRILHEIYKLPFNDNTIKMQNHKTRYRLRVGDYRIIYEKYNDELLIIVIAADNRGDIY